MAAEPDARATILVLVFMAHLLSCSEVIESNDVVLARRPWSRLAATMIGVASSAPWAAPTAGASGRASGGCAGAICAGLTLAGAAASPSARVIEAVAARLASISRSL